MSSESLTNLTKDVVPTDLKFSVLNLPAELPKYKLKVNMDAKIKILEKYQEGYEYNILILLIFHRKHLLLRH